MGTSTPARRTIRLLDGRRLAYREFGTPRGRPAIYCHGFPGTSVEAALVADLAVRRDVRLVAIDRPGFGGSTFDPHKPFDRWPEDVAALADTLGLDRFAVLGMSGGGPYALACGRRLAARVTRVGVVSGMGPLTEGPGLDDMMALNRWGLRAARAMPGVLQGMRGLFQAVLRRRPGLAVAHLERAVAPVDRALFRGTALGETLRSSFRESAEGDARALIQEAVLFSRPWGGWLREVELEVLLWHGEQDRVVPPSLARGLAGTLRRCRAAFHPDDGHFSLPLRQADTILQALLS